jgi:hypothetical protein
MLPPNLRIHHRPQPAWPPTRFETRFRILQHHSTSSIATTHTLHFPRPGTASAYVANTLCSLGVGVEFCWGRLEYRECGRVPFFHGLGTITGNVRRCGAGVYVVAVGAVCRAAEFGWRAGEEGVKPHAGPMTVLIIHTMSLED